ncbi:MAG: protein kinase, partial [Lentisphaeria bacterium]|nr:protein kinase [Lentisphaeria bacterium]
MEYKAGDELCSCTLLSRCGSGAYGEVWLAKDPIGARVALKIITDRGAYSQRELAGLRNYRDCNHPNLLKIRYVEITEERFCCIMDAADDLNHGQGEYVPDTLANRLNRQGRMEGKEVLSMLEGLLDGLEELHKHGLVHRDVKPDNILWVNGRPTLADAGLIAQEGKGSLVGTPGFLSPKLLSGKGSADTSDDFYALGKVIYCALTGLPVREYPSIPENMTISVDAALGRALREGCTKVIRSAEEFRQLLRQDVPLPRDGKFSGNRAGKILLLLLLFPGVLAGVFLFLAKRSADRTGSGPQFPASGGKSAPAKPRPSGVTDYSILSPEERAEVDRALQDARGKNEKAQKEREALLAKAGAGLKAMENANANALKLHSDRAAARFRQMGLLPGDGKLTESLLGYEIMTRKELLDALRQGTGDPRLRVKRSEEKPPPAKRSIGPSSLELALAHLVGSYPDFDLKKVKER